MDLHTLLAAALAAGLASLAQLGWELVLVGEVVVQIGIQENWSWAGRVVR